MLHAIAVLAAIAFYFMKPDERTSVLGQLHTVVKSAYESAQGGAPEGPVRVALQSRNRFAVVTPALMILQVAVFAITIPGSDAQTLIASGASTGVRTTNGEWHRLALSIFVHSGALQLAVNLIGLGAVGFIVERIAGPVAFTLAFCMAGVFASVVNLAVNPMGISFGASGAILGIYGLLIGFGVRYLLRPPDISIPLTLVKTLGTAAGVFIVYNLFSESLSATAELSGLLVGIAYGSVLSGEGAPARGQLQRIGIISAASAIVIIGVAARQSGIDDVRPEVATLTGLERQTAEAYDAEVARYRTRPASENRLVQLIDGSILPQLRATAARLNAFDRVLPEQRQLIENARAYVRLRQESWQLRADGLRQMMTLRSGGNKSLHKSSEIALRSAEARERAALEALHGISVENQ